MKYADSKRMVTELYALASMSTASPKEGITRISWTKEYAKGTDFIKEKMLEAGLEVWEDAIGNVCGCMKGKRPKGSIVSGSHLDTVYCAGAYDGVMGVICALETARLLQENGICLQNNYSVLAMVEEEGIRTGSVLTGSTYIRKCMEADIGESVFEWEDLKTKDGEKLSKIIREYKETEKNKGKRKAYPAKGKNGVFGSS